MEVLQSSENRKLSVKAEFISLKKKYLQLFFQIQIKKLFIK